MDARAIPLHQIRAEQVLKDITIEGTNAMVIIMGNA